MKARKICRAAGELVRFYPSFSSPPLLPRFLILSVVLCLDYLPGSVELPPEGFRTSLSYVCSSLDAQNHSAISH